MSSDKKLCIYLVIPCYNEREVLPETSKRLHAKVSSLIEEGTIAAESRILFVDDGSKDGTWAFIEGLTRNSELWGGVKLSHNRGHQNALLAGMMEALPHCDAIISMDADLQDSIEAIDEFIAKHLAGAEVVYGVRSSRDTDTAAKRGSARMFYRFMKRMGAETIEDHADYRLMGKRSLEALSHYPETNLYLRGIIPDLGFSSDVVYYERGERFAGESKYPLRKMVSFALDGITSFSNRPLKLISSLGIICAFLSIVGLLYALISWLTGNAVPGWTAITCSIWLLGGIQLICIGVLGTYIGKIYGEAKARPRYIVEKEIIS